MEIGIIGFGKMGLNLAYNLKDHGYLVKGTDVNPEAREQAGNYGIESHDSLEQLLMSFSGKKTLWLMLPAGKITDTVLDEIAPFVSKDDVIIEGGNSNYKDSMRRAKAFAEQGIHYFDCGTSGGISGARNDACLMIGGNPEVFKEIEKVFEDVSVSDGYLYAGKSGSGHFLKMIHNGIEYGMMQAIGEGFQLVEQSEFDFNLEEVAKVWNHGSVIRGWLMEIIEQQFSNSPHLEEYKGTVAASGEAKWTVETALEMDVAVPTIALSLFMRNLSQEEDSFSAKVVSALRNGFGGHEIVKK
ncbi:phosphogluconate dehydrogenase (NAD(+)-dependent, decarboxylating) [Vagococcus zengguangii]|uniref:Decarboxylating 6-phosphogluconate dehydrogenase n=1 Tax=Vagococcus zengguangii TaxID=2571750 RepID=A0A4D7CSR6_9ENTE|nr:decarboxylating 6-phosphogluconate dehydrogenase [Vagococcus zengguangii]QCI85550.1 decarboxylating 6-phosphogluconate dehydrogenase [Vagococcus zengguangii]TLG79403.1 decarboxylating 6-phosphogluconate dehydrogenase [Vagococcus zengguangii]